MVSLIAGFSDELHCYFALTSVKIHVSTIYEQQNKRLFLYSESHMHGKGYKFLILD